jgi:sugar transferase EpsL
MAERGFYPTAKRAFDLLVTIPLLLLLAPVLLLTALVIWLVMGRPVLFRQQRPGLHGRPFTLLKFRTMRDVRDAGGASLPDEVRLTRLGRLLREFSLDELPELINVLRGEMSLVGPRPLLMQYLERYTPRQMRRHDVLPGITGWAQINGRNAVGWDERFALDLWYVQHRSFRLDLAILVATVRMVLRREGIHHVEHATMPEFTGSVEQTGEGE